MLESEQLNVFLKQDINRISRIHRNQKDKSEAVMEQYKKEFIEFMIDCNVLKFGDFVTKSGRKTPFFVNTGFYRTGSQLKRLGEYYAQAIHDHFGFDFDVLFGPAYVLC